MLHETEKQNIDIICEFTPIILLRLAIIISVLTACAIRCDLVVRVFVMCAL